MAISIRQALAENNLSEPAMVEQYLALPATTHDQWSEIQGLATQLAEKLCERLRFTNWLLPQWFSGSTIPAAFLEASTPGMRRIVEIGCGEGALTHLMALLWPEVEIVGIDADGHKIEKAQQTVGHCGNIRFVQGHAHRMDEMPCDRIVYNHCLSHSANVFQFKKMIFKTSQWLVDEGDFWVKESLPGLLTRPATLQTMIPYLGNKNPLETLMAHILASMGHPLGDVHWGQGLWGLSSELFFRSFPLGGLTPTEAQDSVTEASTPGQVGSVSGQTNDALLKILFEASEQDWRKILV